jgi:hypothetical protein
VYQNGIKLGDADYTSTSGTSIVLAQGASVDDLVVIVVFDVFSVADTVSKADGGTFDGNVTMAGTLGVTGNGTVGGTLGVTGASTLTGALSAKGGAVFNEDSADVDFRVESNGNTHGIFLDAGAGLVGIGNSNPDGHYNLADDLVIGNGSGGRGLTIYSGNDSSGYIGFNDAEQDSMTAYIQYGHNGDYMAFASNGSERMRINSSGDVMIGTTTVDLSAVTSGTGTTVTSTGQLLLAHDGNNMAYMNLTNYDGGTENFFVFLSDASVKGSIGFNGSSTVYATSSDHRLKENVTADWDATTRLKQLNPVRFNFIGNADRTVDGFLAHEVQSVVPEAITGTHNEVDDDGNAVYQGIDQSKLVPLLVKTIQELEARITALENAE